MSNKKQIFDNDSELAKIISSSLVQNPFPTNYSNIKNKNKSMVAPLINDLDVSLTSQ